MTKPAKHAPPQGYEAISIALRKGGFSEDRIVEILRAVNSHEALLEAAIRSLVTMKTYWDARFASYAKETIDKLEDSIKMAAPQAKPQ